MFPSCDAWTPFTQVRNGHAQLSESGAQEDVLIVTFTMLVLSLNVSHNGSLVTFDYLHGTDGVSDNVSNSATDGGETSKADDEVRLLMV